MVFWKGIAVEAWKRRGLELAASVVLAGVFTLCLGEPAESPGMDERVPVTAPAWTWDMDVEFQRKVCRHIPDDLRRAQTEMTLLGFRDSGEMMPEVIEACMKN